MYIVRDFVAFLSPYEKNFKKRLNFFSPHMLLMCGKEKEHD